MEYMYKVEIKKEYNLLEVIYIKDEIELIKLVNLILNTINYKLVKVENIDIELLGFDEIKNKLIKDAKPKDLNFGTTHVE